jgi:hypothetical protein
LFEFFLKAGNWPQINADVRRLKTAELNPGPRRVAAREFSPAFQGRAIGQQNRIRRVSDG